MAALGFGGYAALKLANLKPAVIQLNETATIFAAIARLDELCSNGMNIYEAIVYVRKITLCTPITLWCRQLSLNSVTTNSKSSYFQISNRQP